MKDIKKRGVIKLRGFIVCDVSNNTIQAVSSVVSGAVIHNK